MILTIEKIIKYNLAGNFLYKSTENLFVFTILVLSSFLYIFPTSSYADTTIPSVVSCAPLTCDSYGLFPAPTSNACGVTCPDPRCNGLAQYDKYSFSCSSGDTLECCCCGCVPPTVTPTPTPTATPYITVDVSGTPAGVVIIK